MKNRKKTPSSPLFLGAPNIEFHTKAQKARVGERKGLGREEGREDGEGNLFFVSFKYFN